MRYIRVVYKEICKYLEHKPDDHRGLEKDIFIWDRNVYLTMVALNERFGEAFDYEEVSRLLREEGLYDEETTNLPERSQAAACREA